MTEDKEGRTVFFVKAIFCADTSDDGTKKIVCSQEGKVNNFTFKKEKEKRGKVTHFALLAASKAESHNGDSGSKVYIVPLQLKATHLRN